MELMGEEEEPTALQKYNRRADGGVLINLVDQRKVRTKPKWSNPPGG